MNSPTSRRRFLLQGSALVGGFALLPRARTADAPTADDLTARAVAFLKPRQKPDGSWSAERGPGITGIVVTSLLRSKRITTSDPAITKGLAYLEGFIKPNGG